MIVDRRCWEKFWKIEFRVFDIDNKGDFGKKNIKVRI